jgi:uncharacterized membrane-anchored protein YitT (DUF2179 family)
MAGEESTKRSQVDAEHDTEVLREVGVANLLEEPELTLVLDGMELWREGSQQQEYLMRVKALDDRLINGYRSFNVLGMGKRVQKVTVQLAIVPLHVYHPEDKTCTKAVWLARAKIVGAVENPCLCPVLRFPGSPGFTVGEWHSSDPADSQGAFLLQYNGAGSIEEETAMIGNQLSPDSGSHAPGPGKILALLAGSLEFTKESLGDYLFVLVGAFIQALAMRLFLVPSQLVSGGISGAAQIINYYLNWPIGLMVLAGNIPLFILGWQYLGGPRFALRTALAIGVFSFFTDFLALFIPRGVVDDLVLNSLYGGVMLGFGLGLVYRGKGTSGGTDILGRMINHRFGISVSQSYMLTDTAVILAAGLVFGWANALYALVATYVSGLAAEMILEGSSIYRTAIIVTAFPEIVAAGIMTRLERGVPILSGKGAYTGQERQVLYCVITRAEVSRIKDIIKQADPRAFMVIGEAHEALGEGFRPLK